MARLLFLDDDADLRAILGELMPVLGHEALCVGSVDELQRLASEVARCDAALLDINLGAGAPSGLDAVRWLRRQRFARPVAFLTGHGHRPAARAALLAADCADVPVLEKPIDTGDLERLLGGRGGAPRGGEGGSGVPP